MCISSLQCIHKTSGQSSAQTFFCFVETFIGEALHLILKMLTYPKKYYFCSLFILGKTGINKINNQWINCYTFLDHRTFTVTSL